MTGASTLRHHTETPLAWLTLILTVIHFIGETWAHILWGQPLQALIVDYISNALMLFGGITSLRIGRRSAAGLLAAAWTFNLGFGWRSVFGRLEIYNAGDLPANGEASFILPLLIGSLILVVIVMFWALALAFRQARYQGLKT